MSEPQQNKRVKLSIEDIYDIDPKRRGRSAFVNNIINPNLSPMPLKLLRTWAKEAFMTFEVKMSYAEWFNAG